MCFSFLTLVLPFFLEAMKNSESNIKIIQSEKLTSFHIFCHTFINKAVSEKREKKNKLKPNLRCKILIEIFEIS